jgi:hypothetical protein
MVFASVKHDSGPSSLGSSGGSGSGSGFSATGATPNRGLESLGHRMPLKRRGLSRFYSSKSQSFSCFQELTTTPYGSSSLVLGKSAHSHLATVRRRLSRRRAAADTDSSGCMSSSAPVSPIHSHLHSDTDSAESMAALLLQHAPSMSVSAEDSGCWAQPSVAPDDAGDSSLRHLPQAAPITCMPGLLGQALGGCGSGSAGSGMGDCTRREVHSAPGGWAVPPEALCSALEVVSLSAPAACELRVCGRGLF